MLTLGAREGRGRIATWTAGDATVTTPALLHIDHPQAPRNGQQLILTANPIGEGLEVVPSGTWFHPQTGQGLLLPEMAPRPTTEVQVFFVDDLAIWHDAGGWCSNPATGVPALIDARKQATAGKVLYAPALGYPHNYALWAYAGVDLFDASNLHLAAVRGIACTMDGVVKGTELGLESTQDLLQFNLDTAEKELQNVRRALQNGNVRDLAERRSYADPSAVAVLRRLDRQYHYLEATSPQDLRGDMRCMTPEAVNRPDVERYRRKLSDYTPPAQVLVLLPCSQRKPYRLSKTHRYFQRALDESGGRHAVHEVMVTSPMGLVPRELEEIAPANRYDVPVTGKWSHDEREMIRTQMATLLEQGDYTHIIAHVDQDTFDTLRDLMPDARHTAMGRPSSIEDCARLQAAVREICGGGDLVTLGKARKLRDMEAIASFQFGSAGAKRLLEGANAKGKTPFVKLFEGEEQLGMNRADRGYISLTLAGAKKLGDALPCITIGDFELSSKSLFSAGVEAADPRIRAGDEVGIIQNGQLIASGVAELSAEEMLSVPRGIAAKLRHMHKEVA